MEIAACLIRLGKIFDNTRQRNLFKGEKPNCPQKMLNQLHYYTGKNTAWNVRPQLATKPV